MRFRASLALMALTLFSVCELSAQVLNPPAGSTFTSSSETLGWSVVGVGDFNRDGHPDYLLYNGTTRQTAIWYLNNNVLISGLYGPTLPAGWSVAGVADFNRDSHPDCLLYNGSTRQTAIWYLNNNVLISGLYGPTLPVGWSVVGVADFNRDGYPDYLLYNATTRQTAIWYLKNNILSTGLYGPTLPVGWNVVGVADFKGDGHPDYLLYNASTGQTAIWYLKNNVLSTGLYGPTLPVGWNVVGVADFKGDGHPDYLLYNASTGQTAIWYLNNNVPSAGLYGPALPPPPTPTPAPSPTPTPAGSDPLTVADVQNVINRAVTRAVQVSPNSVIAVTDREGYVLGVWVVRGGSATPGEIATAVSKAGTAAYLSSNQNAFTTRTAGYIIQQHFPVGVMDTAPGPLVGVGLSSLFVSDVNHFKKTDLTPCPPAVPPALQSPGTLGTTIPFTSLDGAPGGVPLYKNGALVGGVGITGAGTPLPPISSTATLAFCATTLSPGIARAENPFVYIGGYDADEDIALAGQTGYAPSPGITADNVFLGGIRLPYTNSSTSVSGTITLRGNADPQFPIQGSLGPPPGIVPYVFAGVPGEIRQPIINDPLPGTINGQPRLSATEVAGIINYAAQRVKITRAAIRLPIGTQMEAFITVVNNPNSPGVTPTVLGTFRTGEATLFSWDVAVQKARTALYYSSHDFLEFGLDIAMSTRCIGFLAQCNYPPGIDGNSSGPFLDDQAAFSGFVGNVCADSVTFTASPGTPGLRNGIIPDLPNGITIFPGGLPLYRNGVLIGAIGISGDGVDQDDIVAASGTHDFLAPFGIRSDQFSFRGTPLPYVKFPRDPGL